MLRGEERFSSLKDRQAWEILHYKERNPKAGVARKAQLCLARLFFVLFFLFFCLFIMKNFVTQTHFCI